MENNLKTLPTEKYENTFVPSNFVDYFKDKTFMITIKFLVFLLSAILFAFFYSYIQNVSFQTVKVSHIVIIMLWMCTAYTLNECWILYRKIKSVESFGYRYMKLKNIEVHKAVRWSDYFDRYRKIDTLFIVIFFVVMLIPHLYYNERIREIGYITIIIEAFLYLILRLMNLRLYFTRLYETFSLSDASTENKNDGLQISNFKFKAKFIEGIIIGIFLFIVFSYLKVDVLFRIISYSILASFLYVIWNGVLYGREQFGNFVAEIDELMAKSER